MQARETAGITTRLIIEETRRWGGDQAVLRLLELAGETGRLDELSDERSWFSYETRIALFEAAAELTGEPHIARHIGAALMRSRIGRTLLVMLTLLGSPAQLLRSIDRASAKFNTVGDMKLLAHGRRSATISYQLHPGYRPNRHDCDLNIGLLSHVPAIYGLPPATIRGRPVRFPGLRARAPGVLREVGSVSTRFGHCRCRRPSGPPDRGGPARCRAPASDH